MASLGRKELATFAHLFSCHWREKVSQNLDDAGSKTSRLQFWSIEPNSDLLWSHVSPCLRLPRWCCLFSVRYRHSIVPECFQSKHIMVPMSFAASCVTHTSHLTEKGGGTTRKRSKRSKKSVFQSQNSCSQHKTPHLIQNEAKNYCQKTRDFERMWLYFHGDLPVPLWNFQCQHW